MDSLFLNFLSVSSSLPYNKRLHIRQFDPTSQQGGVKRYRSSLAKISEEIASNRKEKIETQKLATEQRTSMLKARVYPNYKNMIRII